MLYILKAIKRGKRDQRVKKKECEQVTPQKSYVWIINIKINFPRKQGGLFFGDVFILVSFVLDCQNDKIQNTKRLIIFNIGTSIEK